MNQQTNKPAAECPCCVRRFEMFNARLREAVRLFGQDLLDDGATPQEMQAFHERATAEVESLISGGDA